MTFIKINDIETIMNDPFGDSSSQNIVSLLEDIKENTSKGKMDIEKVCVTNDGGITVIGAYSVFDTSVNPPTYKLYEFGTNVELVGYEETNCPGTIDREKITVEKCNPDGTWQVITFVNVEDPTDILGPIYVNPDGIISPNPGNLGNCNIGKNVISSEYLNINGLTTLNQPTGGVYAIMSIISGGIWITVDGTTPIVGQSHPALAGQRVYLEIEDDITQFQAVGLGEVFVTYYDNKL